MFGKEKVKGFLAGVVATIVLTTSLTVLAQTVSTQITVGIGGIKIVVDGETINPTDVNGNPVEPIIYKGTTYLPIRALNQALTKGAKPVSWDGVNRIAYIGSKKPVGVSSLFSVMTIERETFESPNILKQTSIINNGNTYSAINAFEENRGYYHGSNTTNSYLLKGAYSELRGVLCDADIGSEVSNERTTFTVYSYNRTANTSTVIYETTVNGYDNPVPFTVSVAGIDEIYLKMRSTGMSYKTYAYNLELVAPE